MAEVFFGTPTQTTERNINFGVSPDVHPKPEFLRKLEQGTSLVMELLQNAKAISFIGAHPDDFTMMSGVFHQMQKNNVLYEKVSSFMLATFGRRGLNSDENGLTQDEFVRVEEQIEELIKFFPGIEWVELARKLHFAANPRDLFEPKVILNSLQEYLEFQNGRIEDGFIDPDELFDQIYLQLRSEKPDLIFVNEPGYFFEQVDQKGEKQTIANHLDHVIVGKVTLDVVERLKEEFKDENYDPVILGYGPGNAIEKDSVVVETDIGLKGGALWAHLSQAGEGGENVKGLLEMVEASRIFENFGYEVLRVLSTNIPEVEGYQRYNFGTWEELVANVIVNIHYLNNFPVNGNGIQGELDLVENKLAPTENDPTETENGVEEIKAGILQALVILYDPEFGNWVKPDLSKNGKQINTLNISHLEPISEITLVTLIGMLPEFLTGQRLKKITYQNQNGQNLTRETAW